MDEQRRTQLISIIEEEIELLKKSINALHLISAHFKPVQAEKIANNNHSYPEKILTALASGEKSGKAILQSILTLNPGNESDVKKAVSKELSRMVRTNKIKVRKIKGVNHYKV